MIIQRKSEDRGFADYGWLKTHHSFSFDTYYDANFMGFGALRVINQDIVAGGGGFLMHGHRNMEIVTYIIRGALEHKDSLGNTSVIRPGEAQRMSAGKGIRHSEFNHSKTEEVELLQIWILPQEQELDPSYEQKSFTEIQKQNEPVLLAGPKDSRACVQIHQQAKIFAVKGDINFSQNTQIRPEEKIWIQLISGQLTVNGVQIGPGDAVGLMGEKNLEIKANSDFHCLMFHV
ncbi:MAG: quercetin 2,3-dioxygenase [Oligoflexia bacterium]|nr:MAG: quercetin 2,3-dioxygenase [Oligoflexia bacterium]